MNNNREVKESNIDRENTELTKIEKDDRAIYKEGNRYQQLSNHNTSTDQDIKNQHLIKTRTQKDYLSHKPFKTKNKRNRHRNSYLSSKPAAKEQQIIDDNKLSPRWDLQRQHKSGSSKDSSKSNQMLQSMLPSSGKTQFSGDKREQFQDIEKEDVTPKSAQVTNQLNQLQTKHITYTHKKFSENLPNNQDNTLSMSKQISEGMEINFDGTPFSQININKEVDQIDKDEDNLL